MNRFHRAAENRPPKPAQPGSEYGIESGLFSRPASQTPRALFAPLHYERNYAYPLLVWLHGPGADERQLMRIMPVVSMRNYVAVAPRGLPILQPDGKEVWGWSQSPEQIQQAEQQILDCVEDAQRRFHIAPNRLFLAGFDSGGTMAFRLAMSYPRRFAGVLSIGGGFPRGQNPLGQ